MAYPFEQDDDGDIELFPHTPGHFCPDMSCPDKEDQDAINQLHAWHQDGLLSDEDRDNIYRGRTL